jgi:hypothetical protein
MQEKPNDIPEGETPHAVLLHVYEANVDVCRPGDRVSITGILRALPMRVNPTQRALHAVFKVWTEKCGWWWRSRAYTHVDARRSITSVALTGLTCRNPPNRTVHLYTCTADVHRRDARGARPSSTDASALTN